MLKRSVTREKATHRIGIMFANGMPDKGFIPEEFYNAITKRRVIGKDLNHLWSVP